MQKTYDQKVAEEKWYKFWEVNNFFKPQIVKGGKPFVIILPPPNANAPLHFGHTMYVIEDVLIRYHRLLGFPSLWLPGADHAGFETQFVFEKHLTKEGKSRFDYKRETLYKMIWDFVQKNRPIMGSQLRKLGFALDWSRNKFTLDEDIVKIVHSSFKKMYDDGLVYRAKRLVNYCTRDGTSFSDLEVVYKERQSPLYFIKYGPLTLATTRPETKFGDTGVAVHPKDKRYKKYIGKTIEIETVLGKAAIKVVGDELVDPDFGTGVIKVTPAHDFDDFEIGQRHGLEMKQVIGFDGRLNKAAGKFAHMTVADARQAVVEEMKKKGLVEKIDTDYKHRIGLCYKCDSVIEPLPLEQWFIKIEPLAKKAITAVKTGKIKIFPKSFEKIYFLFLKNIRDWNISRQIVWGIRIPAWFCLDCSGWTVTGGANPDSCQRCQSKKINQDEDTFDTWFSSAQWPFATLKTTSPGDFEYFYPTTVMETGYDILRWWVARMVMVGLYVTGKVPFENIVLHGLVKDPYGKKMSKSRGNIIDPMELADEYGADAVRMALLFGTALGNDQSLSYPKLQAMRNFTNKIWNIARFVLGFAPKDAKRDLKVKHKDDKWIRDELERLIVRVTNNLERYELHLAVDEIYDFVWHKFADKYVEKSKERRAEAQPTLEYVLRSVLVILHPFMPFLTEELYQKFDLEKSIMLEKWPT